MKKYDYYYIELALSCLRQVKEKYDEARMYLRLSGFTSDKESYYWERRVGKIGSSINNLTVDIINYGLDGAEKE